MLPVIECELIAPTLPAHNIMGCRAVGGRIATIGSRLRPASPGEGQRTATAANRLSEGTREELDAARARKLAGLEALLAEDRTALSRLEWHRRLLPTRRARGQGFDPFARDRGTDRAAGPLRFAALAPLRFVLEVLVGEKLLFARRPDELRPAVHAPEDPVLELHRSLPRPGSGRLLVVYSNSRRSFFRLRLRASACFARRLSPGSK